MDKIIMICIIAILLIVIAVMVGIFIHKIKDKNNIILAYEDSLRKIQSSIPTLSIDKRLAYNQELLLFIDSVIELELVNEKRFEIFLNKNDKNLDIDKVLKSISTTVFESLSPDVYSNPDNIITDEYIMNYIQKKTFMVCMSYIQNNVASQL